LEWKKSRRKFGAWDLLLELEPNKPCLSPIIKSGPITKKDPLKGPWALAETPLGFVVKIGAYLDDYLTPVEPDSILNPATGLPIDWGEWPKKPSLDDEIVRAALAAQLGPTFRGVTDLKISQSHLAMAFWTQIVEGKRKALDILAQLNRNWDPKALTTYSPLAEEALSKFNPIDLPPEIDCHRHFQNPFMMALLFKAKKRGIISPSLYIWLKPTDRSLFYSLNQVGAQMAWIEGLGPWSHYLAEARAQTPLADPAVEEALVSLKKTLANERFLPNPVLDAQDEAIRAENEAYRDLIRQGLSPEEASAALSQSYSP
jgi:intracellular multiplication protein IcmP